HRFSNVLADWKTPCVHVGPVGAGGVTTPPPPPPLPPPPPPPHADARSRAAPARAFRCRANMDPPHSDAPSLPEPCRLRSTRHILLCRSVLRLGGVNGAPRSERLSAPPLKTVQGRSVESIHSCGRLLWTRSNRIRRRSCMGAANRVG